MSTTWYKGVCISLTAIVTLGFTCAIHSYKTTWDAERVELEKRIEVLDKRNTEEMLLRIKAEKQDEPTVAPLIATLKPRIDASLLLQLDSAIIQYSRLYELPPELVVFVMKRESNFNPKALSPVGATGLMQVFPKYHKDKMKALGVTMREINDVHNNVQIGCWILREYLNQSRSIDKALTKYVGGKHPSYVKDILVGYTNATIGR